MPGVTGALVRLVEGGDTLRLVTLFGSADGFETFGSGALSVRGAVVTGGLVMIVVRRVSTLGDTVLGVAGVLIRLVEEGNALTLGKLLGSTDGLEALASGALAGEAGIPGRLVFAEGSSCAEVNTNKKVTNEVVFIAVECSSGMRYDGLCFRGSDCKPLQNVPFFPKK